MSERNSKTKKQKNKKNNNKKSCKTVLLSHSPERYFFVCCCFLYCIIIFGPVVHGIDIGDGNIHTFCFQAAIKRKKERERESPMQTRV